MVKGLCRICGVAWAKRKPCQKGMGYGRQNFHDCGGSRWRRRIYVGMLKSCQSGHNEWASPDNLLIIKAMLYFLLNGHIIQFILR